MYQVKFGRDDDDHIDRDGELDLDKRNCEERVRVARVSNRISNQVRH